jgi:hypothetical protein
VVPVAAVSETLLREEVQQQGKDLPGALLAQARARMMWVVVVVVVLVRWGRTEPTLSAALAVPVPHRPSQDRLSLMRAAAGVVPILDHRGHPVGLEGVVLAVLPMPTGLPEQMDLVAVVVVVP